MTKRVKITQLQSVIGNKRPQRLTLKALGLRRINHSVEKELNPAIAGMIASVSYMVKVEELN